MSFRVGERVLYRGREVDVLGVDEEGQVVRFRDPRSRLIAEEVCLEGFTCYPLDAEREMRHRRLAESVNALLGMHVDSLAVQKMVWEAVREYGDEHALAVATWLDSVREMLLEISSSEGVKIFTQTTPL